MDKKKRLKGEIQVWINNLCRRFKVRNKNEIKRELEEFFVNLSLVDKEKIFPSEYSELRKFPKEFTRKLRNFVLLEKDKDKLKEAIRLVGAIRARLKELVNLYPQLKPRKFLGKILSFGPYRK